MSKADEAYALMRGWVADGTFQGGQRIVVDQLSRETGISAVPWREALQRLETQGWVEFTENVGARVATFDQDRYTKTVKLVARLGGYATALSLPHLRAADLDRARALNDGIREALAAAQPERVEELNREFHDVFYARCDDEHLYGLLMSESGRLTLMRRLVYSYVPERAAQSVVEHDELIALASMDSADRDSVVEQFARDHMLRTMKAVEEAAAAMEADRVHPS